MGLQIIGFGQYLPQQKIENEFFAKHFGVSVEDIFQQTGVRTRHKADLRNGECTADMAVRAVQQACARAMIKPRSLDLILNVSALPQQAIPDTSVFIQKGLGLGQTGISCFSVHSTCLGFLRGLEIAQGLFQMGQYQKIAIVSSEISSIGLNPEDPHTYPLFGDAAAAFIVENNSQKDPCTVRIKTFGNYADAAVVRGGGTALPPSIALENDYMFEMKGSSLLKYALKFGGEFLQGFFSVPNDFSSVDWIVPHQPSRIGLQAMDRFLPSEKRITTLSLYGNCISASIPLSLIHGIVQNKIQKGDRIFLIGTGAGFSLGGSLLIY